MKRVLLKSVALYQFFSKDLSLWGSRCVFYPSCSEYSHEAIEKYGAVKGMRLSIMRILRCLPGKSFTIDLLK